MIQYTVVATTFNDGSEIERYLESICAQTVLPVQIIIADGGSKDNTVELIEKFAERSSVPVRAIFGKRLNISEGYNTAIRAVETEYVGITGIGNLYAPDYFERLSRAIGDADVAYSPVRGYDGSEYARRYNQTFLNGAEGDFISIATNHGALIRKIVFEQLGYFYEKFVYAGEDAEFYTLVKEKGYKTVIVPEAKALWYTPSNQKEFFKQIKGYAIADMQIQGKIGWLNYKKKDLIKAVLLALAIITTIACLIIKPSLALLPFAMLIAYFIRMALKNKGKNVWMILQKRYMSLYYVWKNRKYFAEEYKVKR